MWFAKFYHACEKYGFTFSMVTFSRHQIVLRPNDTYGQDILIEKDWITNDKQLFKMAIQAMKNYRLREERAF